MTTESKHTASFRMITTPWEECDGMFRHSVEATLEDGRVIGKVEGWAYYAPDLPEDFLRYKGEDLIASFETIEFDLGALSERLMKDIKGLQRMLGQFGVEFEPEGALLIDHWHVEEGFRGHKVGMSLMHSMQCNLIANPMLVFLDLNAGILDDELDDEIEMGKPKDALSIYLKNDSHLGFNKLNDNSHDMIHCAKWGDGEIHNVFSKKQVVESVAPSQLE